MQRMNELCHQLEIWLGPDTGDLAMRFGLHSGPVTAGVLRGEKSRFQLFGDTVNTAARIESTGQKNRIHISEETKALLDIAGKGHWAIPRDELVHAKGKGEIKTFWLVLKEGGATTEIEANKEGVAASIEQPVGNSTVLSRKVESVPVPMSTSEIPLPCNLTPKMVRLVDWNVDVLLRLLRLIIAKRTAQDRRKPKSDVISDAEMKILNKGGMILDEVVEIITLPKFDSKLAHNQADPNTIEIPPLVVAQLREYVRTVATMYRENPFHNFEHASHVTMSVSKLLSRIVAPDIDDTDNNLLSTLHDHTYGITSDPLTQFAVVLSALIHDVDHVGIPNFLLIEENKTLATIYQKKSVAEQNSVDLAWQALMEPQFALLRSYIYDDVTELERFRQLLANTVLATDIFDKELQTLRKNRWAKAFDIQAETSDQQDDVNRKATIVIEHLIQASDVAHTMQHWHVYQKWNERLFLEMFTAYKKGRSPKNPVDGWYQGELGFFDNYIIPLAKKLKDCGVFGVSSDEYLNYALDNRREWEVKGELVVQEMIQKYDASKFASVMKPAKRNSSRVVLTDPSRNQESVGSLESTSVLPNDDQSSVENSSSGSLLDINPPKSHGSGELENGDH